MNTTLTGLFTLECIMKIFSFGFRVTNVTPAAEGHLGRRRVNPLFYSVLESAGGGPVMSCPEKYSPMIVHM